MRTPVKGRFQKVIVPWYKLSVTDDLVGVSVWERLKERESGHKGSMVYQIMAMWDECV